MIDPNYAHPEALVTTEWVASHLNEPNARLVESNEDILLYGTGHIPGAVHIDWRADLQDQTMRDYISPGRLCRALLEKWNHQEYDGHLLRRQVQLVVLLRALGLSALRA